MNGAFPKPCTEASTTGRSRDLASVSVSLNFSLNPASRPVTACSTGRQHRSDSSVRTIPWLRSVSSSLDADKFCNAKWTGGRFGVIGSVSHNARPVLSAEKLQRERRQRTFCWFQPPAVGGFVRKVAPFNHTRKQRENRFPLVDTKTK